MKEHTRNIAVGMTVIVALIMLGWMILVFAGLPQIFQTGYTIRLTSDSTHDVHEGDAVHLAGMRVGRIMKIDFTDGDPRKGVTFIARIKGSKSIPGNATAYVYTRGFGGAYVELKADGPPRMDLDTNEPMDYLPKDGSVVMAMKHHSPSLFPDELTDAFKGLSSLADNLNAMIAPAGDSNAPPEIGPDGLPVPLQSITGAVVRLNRTLDSVRAFADDARESVGAISESATAAADRFEVLARRLIEDADKIAELMTTINKIAMKMESGEGTAGMLLNDTRLYENMLDLAHQMGKMLEEFRSLTRKWKTEGVRLKM